MRKATFLSSAFLALTLLFVGCASEVEAPLYPYTNGTITHNEAEHYIIYTPPGYSPDGSYPVLYMLHGFGGSETYFTNTFSATDAADQLIAEGDIDPIILVFPSGANDLGGTFYTNSLHPLVGNSEQNILDVIHAVEADYAIDTTRRAIGGHSMGGYGAFSITMNHPGMFKSVSAIAAPLTFWGTMPDDDQYKGIEELLPTVLAETGYDTTGGGDLAAYQAAMYPAADRTVTSMMFAMAAAFSPTDPANPGMTSIADYGVDLPIGLNGMLDMNVWTRWMGNDVLSRFMTGQAANLVGVNIYLDAGNDEPTHGLGLNGAHQVFAGALMAGGFAAEVVFFDGVDDIFGGIPAGHVEQTYERIKLLLKWHSGNF